MHHPSAPYCLHSSSTDGPHRTLKNQGVYGPHKTLFAAVGAVESEAVERMSEAGEPTGAREHVCGPGVILTTSVKGAREGARVKIMLVGCPQTAGRASRSGEGLASARRSFRPPPTYFSKSPTASEMASAIRSWPAVEGCRRSLSALLKYASCARETG